jgi:hypothetical protein
LNFSDSPKTTTSGESSTPNSSIPSQLIKPLAQVQIVTSSAPSAPRHTCFYYEDDDINDDDDDDDDEYYEVWPPASSFLTPESSKSNTQSDKRVQSNLEKRLSYDDDIIILD